MAVEELRASPMMAHLLDALDEGLDVGHYGRLVFAIVARYFLATDEIIVWLCKDPACDEVQSKALVHQVLDKGYSPPHRETIIQWQARQSFAICPDVDDPDGCNVYRDLRFPDEVYRSITDYHAEKLEL